MNTRTRAFLCALALGIASVGATACTTTAAGSAPTLVAPKTVNQSLAEAEIAFTGAVTAADTMYNSGVITKDQAMSLVPALQNINTALDAAEAAVAIGDTVSAQAQLGGAQSALATIANVLMQMRNAAQ